MMRLRCCIRVLIAVCVTVLLHSAAAAELPERDRARLGLALSYSNLGSYDKALPLLEDLYRRYPLDTEIALGYIRALGFSNEPAEAVVVLKRLRQLSGNARESDLLEAAIYEANQQFSDAHAVYLRMLARQPDDSALLYRAARSASWAGDHDSAIELFEKLAEQRPDDHTVAAGLAEALYASGDTGKAEEHYRRLYARRPGDAETGMKLAELLAARQAFDEAADVYEKLLSHQPGNREVRLRYARVLSWARRYDDARAEYKRLIDDDRTWVLPRREKARMLGWQRDYVGALDEYERILSEVGHDEGTWTELTAKRALYDYRELSAAREYRIWISLEPDNLEALYDLGQIYSRQKQWEPAREMYVRTLDLFPQHWRARQSLEKLNIVSTRPFVETGFEAESARSGKRSVDRRSLLYYAAVQVPLRHDINVRFAPELGRYGFRDHSTVQRRSASAELEYFNLPRLRLRAGYAFNNYSDRVDNSHTFFEEAGLRLHDRVLLTLSHHRRDVIENARTLRKGLQKDDYLGRIDVIAHRRLNLGFDYQYSNYTDSNYRQACAADMSYQITFEPSSLMFFYRYEWYSFDRRKPDYFSPSRFHYNQIGLEFRQFLNREELFWGINETYVSLRYWLILETGNERGHVFYADFHHDFTSRFSMHVEGRFALYEDRSVYRHRQIMGYIRYYF